MRGGWTEEELAEMAAADAEIDCEFQMTWEEWTESQERDAQAELEDLDDRGRRRKERLRKNYREKAEEKRRYARDYREKHKDARRAYDREYKRAHAEEGRAYMRAWRESRKEELAAYNREYRLKNLDRLREADRERKRRRSREAWRIAEGLLRAERRMLERCARRILEKRGGVKC